MEREREREGIPAGAPHRRRRFEKLTRYRQSLKKLQILVNSLAQSVTEMSTIGIPLGVKKPVFSTDKYATFMCRLSENPGSLNLCRDSFTIVVANKN